MRIIAIAIVLLALSGCSGTGVRAINNVMCNKHADEASCVADTANQCHWNKNESACKD